MSAQPYTPDELLAFRASLTPERVRKLLSLSHENVDPLVELWTRASRSGGAGVAESEVLKLGYIEGVLFATMALVEGDT